MLKYLRHKTGSSRKDRLITFNAGGDGDAVKMPLSHLKDVSEVFASMSKAELKKFFQTRQEDVTVATLKKIVEFLQQGSVSFLNHNEALETLTAVYKYKIRELQKLCEDYLANVCSVTNVCDIFGAATDLNLGLLKYSCLRCIDEHTLEVISSRNFLLLRKSAVKEIISRDSLNVESERVLLDSVLGWGFNDVLRRGLDPNDHEELTRTVKSLLTRIRFSTMTQDQLREPEVNKYHQLLNPNASRNRQRTISSVSGSSSTAEECAGPRRFTTHYTVNLNTYESVNRTMKAGDTFCLRIDILKGSVFLTGLTLAMRAFAATKDTACLYVMISATNVTTKEQETNRGAFLNMSGRLAFPSPLEGRESESVEVELKVIKAENVCPLSVRNDSLIVMPDSQKVAMKIHLPLSTDACDECPCIFKEIEYFY